MSSIKEDDTLTQEISSYDGDIQSIEKLERAREDTLIAQESTTFEYHLLDEAYRNESIHIDHPLSEKDESSSLVDKEFLQEKSAL